MWEWGGRGRSAVGVEDEEEDDVVGEEFGDAVAVAGCLRIEPAEVIIERGDEGGCGRGVGRGGGDEEGHTSWYGVRFAMHGLNRMRG